MKDCDARGYSPLYVKSFKSWAGEEYAMQAVFDKAREMAPCVLILEDLDSLINNSNRSFFLNQLDGFDGNDGLLLIGSTNHLDQLDPALNNRPSRFDRKLCVCSLSLPFPLALTPCVGLGQFVRRSDGGRADAVRPILAGQAQVQQQHRLPRRPRQGSRQRDGRVQLRVPQGSLVRASLPPIPSSRADILT